MKQGSGGDIGRRSQVFDVGMPHFRRRGHYSMLFQRRLSRCAIDAICLVLIVLISAEPYVLNLGFYSDDWAFLSHYAAMASTGPFELIREGLRVPALARPLQGIYFVLLFETFGLWPLPYHLVNTSVIAICVVLLWVLLNNLTKDRRISFAVAVTFALLPQLSTVRVWYAAFQIPMSLVFFLIASLYELRWARGGGTGSKVLSLLAGACCLGFYETFGPLLVAIAVGSTFIRAWRVGADRVSPWIWAALPQFANVLLVLIAVALKGLVSERGPRLSVQFFRNIVGWMIYPQHDWRINPGLNFKSGFIVHFWDTVFLPFRSTIRIVESGDIAGPLAAAAAIGIIVYWRLIGVSTPVPRRAWALRLMVIGVAVFCLGYSTFLLSSAVALSPAGIANRTAVAAALGVAAILVSLALLIASLLPVRAQAEALAVGLAIMAAFASIRIADVGHHWDAASAAQSRILRNVRTDLAGVKADTTIILDGICPYIGPGIVFETSWDVAGALTLALGKTVNGDIVTSRMNWNNEGLASSIYGATTFYPYGEKLLIYNPVKRWLIPLNDAGAATEYFARTDRFVDPCQESFVATGVPI